MSTSPVRFLFTGRVRASTAHAKLQWDHIEKVQSPSLGGRGAKRKRSLLHVVQGFHCRLARQVQEVAVVHAAPEDVMHPPRH